MPLNVSSTCAHRQEVKIVLYSIWYHHTYRCIITPIGIIGTIQHLVSSHLEVYHHTYRYHRYYTASGIITPTIQHLVSSHL